MLHTKSPHPQCYIPSPKVIGHLVLKKKIFKGFFTIYGHGGHLCHVTRTIWTNFSSYVLRSLHMKVEFNWTSGPLIDARVTGILLNHPIAFSSGELKIYAEESKQTVPDLGAVWSGTILFAHTFHARVIGFWHSELKIAFINTTSQLATHLKTKIEFWSGLKIANSRGCQLNGGFNCGQSWQLRIVILWVGLEYVYFYFWISMSRAHASTRHSGLVAVKKGTKILFWFTVIHSMSKFFTTTVLIFTVIIFIQSSLRYCSPFWLKWSLLILKLAKYQPILG